MSNIYEGIHAGDMPTAPYGGPGAAPGGPGGTGSGGRGSGGGPGKGGWSRGKRAAALLAACTVVGGGAFAVVQGAAGSPAPAQAANTQAAATQTGTQAGSSASVAGQAAMLRDVLTTTGIRRLARLRLLGGMYGQYTYETKNGPGTLAFERGTITSVGSGDVMIRAADGTTWTWALTGTSVVREQGTKEPESALTQGQAVFVGGPVIDGARDARLIVIRTAGTTPKTSDTA